MAEPREIEVPRPSIARLGRMLGQQRSGRLLSAGESGRRALGNHVVWNVNSTATGGGVAEMLRLLVGYANEAGVDTRWVVIEGDPEFFLVTKRLHNRLHGIPGDDGELGRREADHYEAVLRANASSLCRRVRPGDVVLLHDPQTAGMAVHLARRGARVVWRCHIGADSRNALSSAAWAFLLPYLSACRAFVFSHRGFVPPELAGADVWLIEPSIDPLSPKNRPLPRVRVKEVLGRIGLLPGESVASASSVLGDLGPLSPEDRVVVQVSRWDRLKDMVGVLHGFAEHVAVRSNARLALVGPAVDGVADDPEGADVLAECLRAWDDLPPGARQAIRLVALPVRDTTTNAVMVNAVQRHATVVTQKSIREGFGLTVTESMWKSRPVVASAVGGIVDQMPPGTGMLLDDPFDLDLFGRTLVGLLGRPSEMTSLGRKARQHVRRNFLTDRHLIDYGRLLEHVVEG